MHRPRIIPVLLLQGSTLCKSIRFEKHRYIGDPINAVRLFNDLRADELVFLDINATKENRSIDIELVREIGEEANMPFTVGGGISSLETIQELMAAGAEKVVLNQAALRDLNFVREAVEAFGSSSISVCMDVKKKRFGSQQVYNHLKGKVSEFKPLDYARKLEELGVGEVVVQSVDKDGEMNGYDLDLVKSINEALKIPVVALGGAGKFKDMRDLYAHTKVNALASGSMFIYQGSNRGVLISYPEREEIRDLAHS